MVLDIFSAAKDSRATPFMTCCWVTLCCPMLAHYRMQIEHFDLTPNLTHNPKANPDEPGSSRE